MLHVALCSAQTSCTCHMWMVWPAATVCSTPITLHVPGCPVAGIIGFVKIVCRSSSIIARAAAAPVNSLAFPSTLPAPPFALPCCLCGGGTGLATKHRRHLRNSKIDSHNLKQKLPFGAKNSKLRLAADELWDAAGRRRRRITDAVRAEARGGRRTTTTTTDKAEGGRRTTTRATI